MGYSTIEDVSRVLANALTEGGIDSGSAIPFEIISIGDLPTDTVNEELILQFIRWADETIDGTLGVIYQVPFRRIVMGAYELISDVTAGDTLIDIEDSTRFNKDDVVTITDGDNSERKTIKSIVSETRIEFSTSVSNSYLITNSRIQRLRYPDPLGRMSSMYAAANLYDKFFAADQEPNVSEYGNKLRTIFKNDLNNLLNGRGRLIGQRQMGRKFYNQHLEDSPSVPNQFPGDKNSEEV